MAMPQGVWKQQLKPRAVVRYGVKIFLPSPPNYVTRSPGRETVSSYTLNTLIQSEKHEDLRNALIVLCFQLCSLHDGGATVRVDPAPGFCALATDPFLLSHGITLEIGRVKNSNKNPVAERAIDELGLEPLNLSRGGGPVSDVTLALATANKLPHPA